MKQCIKYQLFIDFKKTYESVWREVLYNIPSEFGIPMKSVKLMKICLNETYSRVQVDKYLFGMFPFRNGLKQGGTLSPLPFTCALEYVIRRIHVNQYGLKLNGTHQLLVYAYGVNILGRSIDSRGEKKTQQL
jgi:hypothetical protein